MFRANDFDFRVTVLVTNSGVIVSSVMNLRRFVYEIIVIFCVHQLLNVSLKSADIRLSINGKPDAADFKP